MYLFIISSTNTGWTQQLDTCLRPIITFQIYLYYRIITSLQAYLSDPQYAEEEDLSSKLEMFKSECFSGFGKLFCHLVHSHVI